MGNKKRYLLIVNPAGGSGRTMDALPEIEQEFRRNDMAYEFHFTTEPMHAVSLVKDLARDFDVVVAVGGDGTINEIINGLPEFRKPFGFIPIGTGNDFARSCCVPYDSIPAAVRILREHDVKKIDVGIINGRRFVNVVGLGFEGQASATGLKLAFIKGSVKYLLAIAWTLIFYKRIPMKIVLDDQTIEDEIYLVSIGNGWNVGGGLQLTPKAKLEDNYFDVCIIRDISRWRVISNFNRLTNGTMDALEEVEIIKSKKVEIISNRQMPLHLDGEQLEGDRSHIKVSLLENEQQVIGNWSDSVYASR